MHWVNTALGQEKINLSNKNALSQLHSYKWERKEEKDSKPYFFTNVLKKDTQLEQISLVSLFIGVFQNTWPRHTALGTGEYGVVKAWFGLVLLTHFFFGLGLFVTCSHAGDRIMT